MKTKSKRIAQLNKINDHLDREILSHETAIAEHNRRSGDLKFDLLVLIDWMVKLSVGIITVWVTWELTAWWLV